MSHDHDDRSATDDRDGRPNRQGDDERESRESIEKTGEPVTDALGNADGAS